MDIVLDGRLMTDREALHSYLQTSLELPAYYGRNLDALFDLLTQRCEPTQLCVTHRSALEMNLGYYAAVLMDTLYDAAAENPNLTVKVL